MGLKPKNIAGLVMVICFAVGITFAQAIPQKVQAGAMEKTVEKTPKSVEEGVLPKITKPPRPEMKVEGEKNVVIRKFLITGNTKISTDELLFAISRYYGKELSINQIKELADILTQKYWDRGYLTSFAYIPQQKLERGILEIEILEGKPGKVKIEGNRYYTKEFIKRYFVAAKKEEILNNKTLERGLLLLNEYPKLNANATLTKGEKPGTTDIIIDAEEYYYPMNFTFFFNNFGSRYSGRNRFGLTWDWGNLTKHGDILSLTGIITPQEMDQMLYYKGSYTLPLNGYGTKLGLSYSYMDYEVGKELAILGIDGEATIFGLSVSHPLIRARNENLSWNAGVYKKQFKNYLLDKTFLSSKDDFSVLNLGVSGDRVNKNHHTYFSLGTTFGLGELLGGMSESEYTTSSRPGLANGDWVKINLDLSRIYQIGRCQLIARMSTQWASDNLVTGEQMVIGGPDSVRGYPTGEYLGDYGYFASAELRTPLLPGKTSLNKYANWAFFIDHAGSYYKEVLPGEDKHHVLTGFGAGLRIYTPCHFHLRFDAGFPMKGKEASDGKDVQYWLQAVLDF